VFERFRHDPRTVLARLAEPAEPRLRGVLEGIARGLPRRPPQGVRIGVLGPATLERGGEPVMDEAWTRRQRVRDLLMLIVARRTITRTQLMATIWPDKPERTGASNLRFTLNQLQSVLEPGREADDLPWYVVSDQDRLMLRSSDLVVIDVDEFTDAIAAGDEHDRDGDPELALAAYRKAAAIYRGDFLADASDPDWGYYEALRLRGQFVRIAARASSLALAAGDLHEAEQLAHRATEIEPLYEPAVRALASTMVASRRLGAARETLAKLTAELSGAGMTPEPATMHLIRRLGGA
jgi:DNA-binding SARP family transcriptional activator